MNADSPLLREPTSGVVLVADDDPTIRLIARQTLAQDGHEVVLATDGQDACRQFDVSAPDVVLLDARMPILDGFDACAAIRRRRDGVRTPVVMITSWDDPASVERAFDSGATDFQTKPLNWRIVRRRVRYMLDAQRSASALRQLAHYDSLTGLPNRRRFLVQLDKAIAEAKRTGQSVAVVFLDLDGFKHINDTLGHQAGDKILQQAADRLLRSFRPGDELSRHREHDEGTTIGRIGGDEFTIFAPHLADRASATRLSDRIRQALARPFQVDGQTVLVTASTGVSVYPFDEMDAEALLKHADAAMYYRKSLGRKGRRATSAPLVRTAEPGCALAEDLRHALDRDELRLRFQPQVAISTGDTVGAEALMRWRHPSRAEMPAAEFVGLAEEVGVGIRVGDWVVRTALRQSVGWRNAGGQPIPVAVNLSHSQLRDSGLVDRVAGLLSAAAVEARRLRVEIMESVISQNRSVGYERIVALRALGIKVALDDFKGTSSGLRVLTELQVDAVTLARPLVRQLEHDGRARAAARSIIELSHQRGVTVVAAGVESVNQVDILSTLGCDCAQGFLFGKGWPADEFERHLLSCASGVSPVRR